MAKFKVGDKVRVKLISTDPDDDFSKYLGQEGTIIKIWGTIHPYEVEFKDDKFEKEEFSEEELELAKPKRGRPPKPKPVKFIAKYEEAGKDPYKEFTSEKELIKWWEEAQKNRNIVLDSIEVFPVGKPMKVEASFKLKEKK